tara:strand:- start:3136 stop:7437 length:4302 start_codon:yes stop_codon:yes gene_type:complete
MANFPLAFYDSAEANDYGGTDVTKNLHYNIHNSNNQTLFTSDGAFDVYTFKEDVNNTDSPERSYSLVIMKNTGAHNSHLNVTDIELDLQQGSINAGFSLVTSLDQINNGDASHDFGGTANILSPSEYQTVLNGLSGTDLLDPEPLGYIKVNANSGTIEEVDFGGSTRYIPFYKPADILANTSDADGISADNLGGNTTYPRYAAFLLKCQPSNSVAITAAGDNKLHIECSGFNTVTFSLSVVAYQTANLGYQQGYVNTATNQWIVDNTKMKSLHEIEQVLTSSDPYNTTNATVQGAPYFNDEIATTSNIYFQYAPSGYDKNCLAFNVGNQPSQSKQWLRIFDNTTNTGGAKIYVNEGVAMTTFDAHLEAPNSKYKLLSTTNQTVSFFLDSSITDDQNEDTSVNFETGVQASNITLLENQNLYVKIENNNSNFALQHYTNIELEGTDYTQYLRPSGEDLAQADYNWKPFLTRFVNFYNPFYVDGNQNEYTKIDDIHVLSGAYNVFSTDVATLQRFTSFNEVDADLSAFNGNVSYQNENTRATNSSTRIVKLIHGVQISGLEATPKELNFNTAPQGIGTNSTSEGLYSVYKHHHIFDYFLFPAIDSDSSVTFNDIFLRFSNLAGQDNCYIEDFMFVDSSGFTSYLDSEGELDLHTASFNTNTEFSPTGIQTTAGSNISTPNRVFSAGFSSGLSYSSYNDGSNNQYLPNSKFKDVKLVFTFTPERKQNSLEYSFNKNETPHGSGGNANVDKLGRKTHTNSFGLTQGLLDFVSGATQQSNSNKIIPKSQLPTTSVLQQGLAFTFSSFSMIKHKPPISISGTVGVATKSDWDESVSDLFITEYSGINKFGTHDASASTREPITNAIIESKHQPLAHSTANATHGMLNNSYAIQNKYSSITRSDSYYYRKYPLNGKMIFKYEKYFNNVGLHQATNSLAEAYGILPGPRAVGSFDSSNQPKKAYETNTTILKTSSAINSANTAINEAFISVNFKNSGNKQMHLVSVSLENEVGDAATQQFGDPRFLFGKGKQAVNSSGVVSAGQGEYYEVPVSDNSANTQKVAPSNPVVKVCTSSGNTTITVNNTDGLKVGQILIAENDTFLPTEGTKIVSIDANANTIVVSNAAAAQSNKDVVFDYENPEYVIWNLVRGKRVNGTGALQKFPSTSALDATISPGLNTNGQLTTLYSDVNNTDFASNFHGTYQIGANVQASAAVWVGAYVIPDATNAAGIKPGTKIVSIVNDNTWNISPAPTNTASAGNAPVRIVQYDRTEFSNDFFTNVNEMKPRIGSDNLKFEYDTRGDLSRTNDGVDDDVIEDATFYDGYNVHESITTGAPHIYFGASAASVGTNDIDEAKFYNRVRVKYIVYDKLDFYGVNQEGITENSITGHNVTVSDANKAHVYEDVYLVKLNFTNTIPELEVSDLEGDTSNNNSVIDFGVLSTG